MKPNYKISTACIIELNEQILMIKEEQNGKVSWDIPAGGLERGETLEEGVIREVKEESGIKIAFPHLKAVYDFLEKEKTTINFLYYIKLSNSKDISLRPQDSDIQNISWFSKEQIQNLIDKKEYEHNLGKERLLCALNGFSNTLEVKVVTE